MPPLLHQHAALPALRLLLVGGLLLVACSESLPPTAAPNAASRARIDRSNEETALAEFTRAFAMGMADAGARNRLLQSFRSSRIAEHKLELTPYLASPDGQRLLGSMAARSGRDVSELTSLVSLVRPLELYMPVAAHRTKWNGDAAILVASALEDSVAPIAFSPDGTPAALSADAPPQQATIALVPVETDFRATAPKATASISPTMTSPRFSIQPPPPCDPEVEYCDPCADGGCVVRPPKPHGIYMNKMTIRDAHEPWIRGAPELDLVLFANVTGAYVPTGIAPTWVYTPVDSLGHGGWHYDYQQSFNWDPNAKRRVYVACAGEKASDWRYFNFNSNGDNYPPWGSTLLAETGEFAMVETVRDPDRSYAVPHQRRIPLTGPFEVQILERDDQHQCPEPPHYYELSGTYQYNFQTDRFFVTSFSWSDFAALFGGNNDLVANFFFSSASALESLNNTFVAGADADIVLTNYLFHVTDVPTAQDPYWP